MENIGSSDVAAHSTWGFVLRVIENALQGDLVAIASTVITGLLALSFGWVLKKIYEHHREVSKLEKKHSLELQSKSDSHEKELSQLKLSHSSELEQLQQRYSALQQRLNEINQAAERGGVCKLEGRCRQDNDHSKFGCILCEQE
jgi:uncharacterized protein YlxW (UPF0749 family)